MGLWKSHVYLVSLASWVSFSATPSVNGLSPVLSAVPNLSISHDETFSLPVASVAAMVQTVHRLATVDCVTLRRFARVRAEAGRRPYCRSGLGLRIKPLSGDHGLA